MTVARLVRLGNIRTYFTKHFIMLLRLTLKANWLKKKLDRMYGNVPVEI